MTVDPWNAVLTSAETHWEPWSATVRWTAYRGRLEFDVREGTKQADGSIWYSVEGGGTSEFDLADTFIRGTIKWDGCSHFWFGTDDRDGYVHLCGKHYVDAFGNIIQELWKIAKENIPAWDASQ